jgi:hypothetical protein
MGALGETPQEFMKTIQRQMLRRLTELGKGKTMCPGRLARDCGSDLKSLRADLLALASSGKIVLSQGGKQVNGNALKGPCRLRLS